MPHWTVWSVLAWKEKKVRFNTLYIQHRCARMSFSSILGPTIVIALAAHLFCQGRCKTLTLGSSAWDESFCLWPGHMTNRLSNGVQKHRLTNSDSNSVNSPHKQVRFRFWWSWKQTCFPPISQLDHLSFCCFSPDFCQTENPFSQIRLSLCFQRTPWLA